MFVLAHPLQELAQFVFDGALNFQALRTAFLLAQGDPILQPRRTMIGRSGGKSYALGFGVLFHFIACAPMRDVPGPPLNVTATAAPSQARVEWSPPSSDGHSPIVRYTVTSTPGEVLVEVTGATRAVIKGLENGTSYVFTVTATNAAGTGKPSEPSNAVTPAPTAPGPPAQVTASGGAAQATVRWRAPAVTGDSPINGYTVIASPGGRTATTTGATQATVVGLQPGSSYTFTVRATNAIGTGPASMPSSPVTASAFESCLGTPTFGSVPQTSIGTPPFAATSADFDGDGAPDLALVTAGTNGLDGLQVMLGRRDGRFEPQVTVPGAFSARDIVQGDFNADGEVDLAVAEMFNSGVALYLGNGDGTFQRRSPVTSGKNPVALAAGDFNGDGKRDLAVVDYGANDGSLGGSTTNLSVLFGNGNGTFQPAINVPQTGSNSIVAADFNGDGRDDLAMGSVWVFLADRFGGFIGPTIYIVPPNSYRVGRIYSADLDGDGNLDIAVPDTDDKSVGVLYGKGDGTFPAATAVPVAGYPAFVTSADVNGDGRVDLITANTNGAMGENEASLILGQGGRTFAKPSRVPVGGDPQGLVAADFDQDGKLDLAVPVARRAGPSDSSDRASANTVTVLLGTGESGFTGPRAFAAGKEPSAAVAADLNLDGKLDVAVSNYRGQDVGVLLGNGDGTFGAAASYPLGFGGEQLATGDFNLDGAPDLAVVSYSGAKLLLGRGDGTFQGATPLVGGALSAIVVEDFNADGKPDLAVGKPDLAVAGAGRVLILLLGNGDGTFGEPTSFSLAVDAKAMLAGDFNHDGAIDVAVVGGAVEVLLGQEVTIFGAARTYSTAILAGSLACSDFNGDGELDLVAASSGAILPGTNGFSLLRGQADGAFQSLMLRASNLGPQTVIARDLNGDGKADVALTNGWTGNVTVALGLGNGQFRGGDWSLDGADTFAAGGDLTGVTSGDFDGDAKPDLAVTSRAAGSVNVLTSGACLP